MDATALFKFSSGLYVVSADDGERAAACLVNTGLQVTSSPLQVSVTVNKEQGELHLRRHRARRALLARRGGRVRGHALRGALRVPHLGGL